MVNVIILNTAHHVLKKKDKTTKNNHVRENIQTMNFVKSHIYVHEYTLPFLKTYGSCGGKKCIYEHIDVSS